MPRKYLFSVDGIEWSFSDWGPIDTIISGQELDCHSSTSFADGVFKTPHDMGLIPEGCVPVAYVDRFKCGESQESAFHLFIIKLECRDERPLQQAGVGTSLLPTLIVGALGLGAVIYFMRSSEKREKKRKR